MVFFSYELDLSYSGASLPPISPVNLADMAEVTPGKE